MDQEKLLTTGEIARHLGVDFRTVIRWIDKGRIRAFRLPERGDRRVRARDFVRFLVQNGLPVPQEYESTMRRVLLVDDEEPFANSMARVLKRHGFETAIATSGFQAGVLLESFRPAIMTLDLKMPGLDGFHVLSYIREQEPLGSVKVLVVSGAPRKEIDQALELGADAVLEKPISNDDLVAKVHILLGLDEPEIAAEKQEE